MALYIGFKYDDSDVVPFQSNEAKFYGIHFKNYEENLNTTETTVLDSWYEGERLYTAKNYNFEPSTNYYSGIDNFTDDNAGPFMIRECCTRYNEITNKQEVVSYEGDSTWDADKTNPEYNRMIEFPLFYWYRPERYKFIVTDKSVDGFLPSVMHFKGGKLYQKAYISKYLLDDEFMSRYGHAAYATNIRTFKNDLKSKGMYVLDFSSHWMLVMLMLIKYGRLDFNIRSLIGSAVALQKDKNDKPISGLSHYIRSKDGIFIKAQEQTVTTTFGLENYYDNHSIIFDGAISRSTQTYIDEDLENINYVVASNTATTSSIFTSSLNLMTTTKLTQNFIIKNLMFDQAFPYVLLAESITSGYCAIPSYYYGTTSTNNYYFATYAIDYIGNISGSSYKSVNANGGYKVQRSPLSVRASSSSTTNKYARSICFI